VDQKSNQPTRLKRILVPLDASQHSLAALEAAAEMAAGLRAELVGLFVEDITLLRLVELPFACEVSFLTTSSERMERRQLERQLRVRAEQMRRKLDSIAAQRRIPWTFRVTRGAVSQEVLQAASEADLTILGKVGWSLSGPSRAGSTVRAIVSQGRCWTMILQHGVGVQPAVHAVYTGSPLSEQALETGITLAELRKSPLHVFIATGDREAFEAQREKLSRYLAQRGVQGVFYPMRGPDPVTELLRASRMGNIGTLIIPSEAPSFQGEPLEKLLNRLETPVLIVRERGSESTPP
jgi:nucleotide-binding universal stress UspA family protein